MIVETGCGYHYTVGDKDKQYYPLTYEGQRQFTEDLIAMLNKHQNVTGLFWWFLEANEYGLDWNTKRVTDSWYNASLFDNETGRALPALYELKNFVGGSSSIGTVNHELLTNSQTWYTIDGRRLSSKPSTKGLYIHDGRKVVKNL
jgi:arabinogalactan endo-1,4-beta-galactosidase